MPTSQGKDPVGFEPPGFFRLIKAVEEARRRVSFLIRVRPGIPTMATVARGRRRE